MINVLRKCFPIGIFSDLVRVFLLLILFFIIGSCGDSDDLPDSPGPTINYYLDNQYTNQQNNTLIVESENLEGFTFVIAGEGFNLNFGELGEDIPANQRIPFSYDLEGSYEMKLTIKNSANEVFLEDNLSWQYSLIVPDPPIINFNKKATRDGEALLLMGGSLSPIDVDIWVEGDALSNPQGRWAAIPDSLVLPLNTSEGDGVKNFKVKYRNIYGNESPLVGASIERKSIGPINCIITPQTNMVDEDEIRIYIAAENEGPLQYLVRGDVASSSSYQDFEGSTIAEVKLLPSEGPKYIEVKVRDQAENYCPKTELEIAIDPESDWYGAQIVGDPIWTDEDTVTLRNTFPYLPGDTPEMMIFGGVRNTDQTFDWIPFQEEIAVELLPLNGHRFVFVQFRTSDKPGAETQRVINSVYLRPYVILNDRASHLDVVLSDIVGTSGITISGCDESYQSVSFSQAYTCTNPAANISVTYTFENGSTLVKTVAASEAR